MQLEVLQVLRSSNIPSFNFMGSGWDLGLQTYQGKFCLVTLTV